MMMIFVLMNLIVQQILIVFVMVMGYCFGWEKAVMMMTMAVMVERRVEENL